MYAAGLPDPAAGRPRPPGAAGPAGGLQGPGDPCPPPLGGQVQHSDFNYGQTIHKTISRNLEGTACCAGLLLPLGRVSGYGQGFLCCFCLFYAILCLVVTLLTLNGNLNNFGGKTQKNLFKKIKKNLQNL